MKKTWLMRAAVPFAVCLVILLMSTPAMAIWEWCEMDPELIIDGHTVTLKALVEGDSADVAQAIHGNTWFRVYVPRGVDSALVSTEEKVKAKVFKDKNLEVDADGGVPFTVSLKVNTQEAYPLYMVVLVDGEVVGEIFGDTSNGIKAQFILP